MPIQPSTPRAVLWDMDGTLLDSAEFHWLSWQEALRGEGVDFSRDRFLSTFGRRNDAVLRDLLGDDLVDAEVVRITTIKEARYRELVRTGDIAPLPGVRDWLARLGAAGWRQAVASSAPKLNIATILEAIGLVDAFAAVAGEEDVDHGKPDPQIFRVAAARLGIPPARCVVVEDAPAGIEGARRAGMRSLGVGTAHGRLAADVMVRSLDELPDDAFARLLAGAHCA